MSPMLACLDGATRVPTYARVCGQRWRVSGCRASPSALDLDPDEGLMSESMWGKQTALAIENFPISGERIDLEWIRAIAHLKAACAQVNASFSVLDPEVADAIVAAADAIIAGSHDDQFPVDVFQTGSGTSTNMNVNEVIATIAAASLGREVHPNDAVNASQSSNDVVPSALHLAVLILLRDSLQPALDVLARSLEVKSEQWSDVVKAGRTHLMDAVPIMLGDVFGGFAAQVRGGTLHLADAQPSLLELAIGGTAVGTGLNAPSGFGRRVAEVLCKRTGLPVVEARNHVEAQSARDALVSLSGVLRGVAISLHKIANDIRLMGSGPHAGLAELELPALAAGSSIMPGKVNPIIPEVVVQVAAQVIGNDAAVAFAGAGGAFEITATIPVIGRNVIGSIRLLAAASSVLATKCVDDLQANASRLRAYAEASPSVVTGLNRFLGYAEAANVAQEALASGRTIREVVIARGHVSDGTLSATDLDAALDVATMARGPHQSETGDDMQGEH